MRVLFINRMLSIERGGGETFDLEISRHLEKLGCTISYLSGLPLFSGAKIPMAHPNAHTIRSAYFGWFPWDKVRGGWRLRVADFNAFQHAAVKWAAFRADQFDIIQVCELPEFVSEWKEAGHTTPVSIRLTAPNFYDPTGGVAKAAARIASGTSLEKMRRGGMTNVENIPNCVDTDLFKPHASDFRQSRGIAADEFVSVYVARFQAFKNHGMLVKAFARFAKDVPRSRLLLAGSGPLMPMIRSLAAQLGVVDKILFLGEVGFRDLPDVYAAADLFTISSDYESFCFAALEAMATNLPVVTTDGGWVQNLVQQGLGGRIVPVGDDTAFAAGMVELARDSVKRTEMGGINRAYVEANYQWTASAKKLLAVYERVAVR